MISCHVGKIIRQLVFFISVKFTSIRFDDLQQIAFINPVPPLQVIVFLLLLTLRDVTNIQFPGKQ